MYPLRIEVFIRHRIQELGLTEEAFILKMTMHNFKRKQKKLHHLFNAQWSFAEQLLPYLAGALNVPESTIDYVIAQTKADIDHRHDVQRRINFQPRAFFMTKLSIPTSITMVALAGVTRYVDISDLDEQDYLKHVKQWIQKYPNKMRMINGFFGGVLGFCIAYTPDLTVHFDLQGNFIDTSSNGMLPGHCIINIR
jgi:hypothetical protein